MKSVQYSADSQKLMEGLHGKLSNFTYLVLAAVALFRLGVFRSVSVRFIICFFQRKVCVNFSKSRLFVLLPGYVLFVLLVLLFYYFYVTIVLWAQCTK